jgi:hypothetical protein
MTGGRRIGARLAVVAAACGTSVALAACGGGGEDAGASVANQEDRFQEAGLKFAECMRENGVDVPDPEAGEPGVMFRLHEGEDDGASFREAEEECRHHLEAARPELSEEQEAEFRDGALEFAECMREHGIDFPDPTFEDGGRVKMGPPEGALSALKDPDFREAAEDCRENLPGCGHMVGPPPGP